MEDSLLSIPAWNPRKIQNSLQHKFSPIGVRIPSHGFPMVEVPESFPLADNPERHLKQEETVEIHEPKKPACNPEEELF